jgi:hypothetical protein
MSVIPQNFPPKHPAEVERRAIDWTAALSPGDAISTSTWAVEPGGLTLSAPALAGALASVLVADGISGMTHIVRNTVTTVAGFTLVEVVPLAVLNVRRG